MTELSEVFEDLEVFKDKEEDKTMKNLKDANGMKCGVFTIVIDEEKNAFVVTAHLTSKDRVVYYNDLSHVDEILSDVKGFGFDIQLEKEEKPFRVVLDKDYNFVMSSKEINPLVSILFKVKKVDYEDLIDYFEKEKGYHVITINFEEEQSNETDK